MSFLPFIALNENKNDFYLFPLISKNFDWFSRQQGGSTISGTPFIRHSYTDGYRAFICENTKKLIELIFPIKIIGTKVTSLTSIQNEKAKIVKTN